MHWKTAHSDQLRYATDGSSGGCKQTPLCKHYPLQSQGRVYELHILQNLLDTNFNFTKTI